LQGMHSFSQINMVWGINQCLTLLAEVSKRNNDLVNAKSYLLRGLKVLVSSGKSDRELLEAVVNFAGTLMENNKYEKAVEVVSIVANYPYKMESLIAGVENHRKKAEDNLAPDIFRAAWERGRTLDLDQVVDELLRDEDQP
jgi:hypothetical protein